MRWWFLQGLQQRVEGLLGQHVDFVDDVNLETASTWANGDVGTQLADFVDAAVAGTVNFQHVHVLTNGDRLASVTLVARLGGRAFFTVQTFCENPR